LLKWMSLQEVVVEEVQAAPPSKLPLHNRQVNNLKRRDSKVTGSSPVHVLPTVMDHESPDWRCLRDLSSAEAVAYVKLILTRRLSTTTPHQLKYYNQQKDTLLHQKQQL